MRDTAIRYETIFWEILEEREPSMNVNRMKRCSIANPVFYDLIHSWCGIFTEICLPIIDIYKRERENFRAKSPEPKFSPKLEPSYNTPANSAAHVAVSQHIAIITKPEEIELTPMAGDLLLKLSFGARIYLSNTIAFYSVRYKNEVYAEIFGCTPDQRKIILEDNGLAVEISGKEHLLLPITKVRAMSYILKNARVLNIYDMEIKDLEPTDTGVARLEKPTAKSISVEKSLNNDVAPISGQNDTGVDLSKVSPKAEETPKPLVVLSKSEQQESSRRLREYNKWLSQQEDFSEFSKWFMKKLKAKGLTREQLNTALKELVKKRGGNHEEAQKLIAKWYEQFHQAQQKH